MACIQNLNLNSEYILFQEDQYGFVNPDNVPFYVATLKCHNPFNFENYKLRIYQNYSSSYYTYIVNLVNAKFKNEDDKIFKLQSQQNNIIDISINANSYFELIIGCHSESQLEPIEVKVMFESI